MVRVLVKTDSLIYGDVLSGALIRNVACSSFPRQFLRKLKAGGQLDSFYKLLDKDISSVEQSWLFSHSSCACSTREGLVSGKQYLEEPTDGSRYRIFHSSGPKHWQTVTLRLPDVFLSVGDSFSKLRQQSSFILYSNCQP
jgi:hypothetical protein